MEGRYDLRWESTRLALLSRALALSDERGVTVCYHTPDAIQYAGRVGVRLFYASIPLAPSAGEVTTFFAAVATPDEWTLVDFCAPGAVQEERQGTNTVDLIKATHSVVLLHPILPEHVAAVLDATQLD